MLGWVRSGALMGAPELIAELGGDADRLAREAGIDSTAFHDPDFPVPVEAVTRYLGMGAETCDCETFGLRLSLRQELSLFGPLLPLFEAAPTIGALLRDLAEFFPLHTKGSVISLERSLEGVFVNYELAAGAGRSHRQVVELGFGILVNELRKRLPAWRPGEICFRHSAPANPELHRRIFGSQTRFNADRNAVFLEDTLLARPFGSGDAAAHRTLSSHLDQQRQSLGGIIRTRTESLVRDLLPFAPCDLAVAARMLKLSRRTLQRRLANEGSSFVAILDSVRADLALYYLSESELSVAEVAEILQFSETSALTRAFRRWYGAPPRQARSLQGAKAASRSRGT